MAQIAADAAYASAEADLRSSFARGTVGLAALQASAGRWLRVRLGDPEQSRIDLGQVVGLDPGGVTGAERADLVRELASAARIRGDATQVVAVVGEEGAGKTWLVARWWAAADPQPIPLLLSGKRVDLIDVTDPIGSLARMFALQEGSADEASVASWRRRLQRWKGLGSGSLRFVLVLDGLNEHPHLPWSDIIRAFGREVRNLGGVVFVTCRPTFWTHEVQPRLANGVEIRRINVVDFSVDEVKAIVARAGHDPETLDPSVLEFIRTPRVLSVALGVLDRLDAADLTRERLLLEYWRARMAERGDGIRHSNLEFNAVLRAHAQEWLKAGGRTFAREDLPDRDPALKRRGAANLAGDLSDIEEGRFLQTTDDGENYAFRTDALPTALGLLIDRELGAVATEGRNVDEELEKAIRPIAGFDLFSEILAAALAVASDRDPDGAVAAAITRAYLSLQNLTDASRHIAHVQLRTVPAPFLAAVELPAADPRTFTMDRRLLAGMLLHERGAPALAAKLSARLDGWLGSWSMAPRPMRWDGDEKRREQHEARVRSRLEVIESYGESGSWQLLTTERDGLPDPMLDLVASRAMAGRPQSAHGAGLVGWGLVGAVAPDLNRARDDLPWTVRLNMDDHAGTAAAIEAALPADPDAVRAQPLRDGMANALRLSGLPRLDAIAERLSPTAPPAPPRGRGSHHDPADSGISDAAGLDLARRQVLGIDPRQAWSTFATGGDDHQLDDAAPVLARHDPQAFADAVRRIATTAPARRGMALRQLCYRLPENSALLDEEARRSVRRALEAAIADPSLLPPDDRHWIVAWMARSLMPWLDASEQLELLLSLPEGMPLYLNLQAEFAPLDAADLDVAMATARQQGGERLRRTLFFAGANPTVPLGDQARSTIVDAFFEPDTAMATAAADLIDRAADRQLDRRLLDEVDRRGLDTELDDELYGRQRAYASACRRAARAVPGKLPPRFAGEVAAALGGRVMDAFTAGVDTLVRRLSAPAPEAAPKGVDLFIGLDMVSPGATRWAEPRQEKPAPEGEEGDLEGLVQRVNAPDGGLAADREERRSLQESTEDYRRRLRSSGFGEVVTEPQIEGLEAATSKDPERSARWLQGILAQSDPHARAQLANVGLVLAQALADDREDLCVEALAALRKLRTPVHIAVGPERVPLPDWALIRAARAPGAAALLAAECEVARNDARLAELARFTDALGAGAWLDGWTGEALADPHPARVARALTVTALRPATTHIAALDEDRGTGFLGQVAAHARATAGRRCWARHWVEVARGSTDPVAFWAAGTLAARVADLRFLADWRDLRDTPLVLRFGAALGEELRQAAVKRESERQGTLFGLKAPDETFWAALCSNV